MIFNLQVSKPVVKLHELSLHIGNSCFILSFQLIHLINLGCNTLKLFFKPAYLIIIPGFICLGRYNLAGKLRLTYIGLLLQGLQSLALTLNIGSLLKCINDTLA